MKPETAIRLAILAQDLERSREKAKGRIVLAHWKQFQVATDFMVGRFNGLMKGYTLQARAYNHALRELRAIMKGELEDEQES